VARWSSRPGRRSQAVDGRKPPQLGAQSGEGVRSRRQTSSGQLLGRLPCRLRKDLGRAPVTQLSRPDEGTVVHKEPASQLPISTSSELCDALSPVQPRGRDYPSVITPGDSKRRTSPVERVTFPVAETAFACCVSRCARADASGRVMIEQLVQTLGCKTAFFLSSTTPLSAALDPQEQRCSDERA